MYESRTLSAYYSSHHASEQIAHKITLAKAEGELLSIAALRRLDLNTGTDEDGFQFYVWDMAAVARDLAELSVRKLIPDSWVTFYDSLCRLAESIDKAAWDFFYQVAIKDEEAFLTMESHDADF
ncbi:hypothetical protein N8Y15_19390 [Enterobacter hormaechei subsp. hoffmannii]|uniref:hypothetical protein n=1 Tax=Enterobacteriaceae TaxID=543 RepID=UPI001260804B|nr:MULTISPECIES: hypothetical protein [Enterobacteriaceae]MCU3194407.1 hypothetical protein [Enterobacter hormaechei subsp. hoffmannii]MDT7152634.1 hypothetical protein [Citrobacter freundii]UTA18685.1 hypothetical protein J3S84_09140 [Enterobacter cloacae]HBS6705863.1 hypothetical protein [Klebsiella pneumoniae]MCC9329893.1 hypothetical protein [Enterobacter hormaechei subsp. steigerwaltii]